MSLEVRRATVIAAVIVRAVRKDCAAPTPGFSFRARETVAAVIPRFVAMSLIVVIGTSLLNRLLNIEDNSAHCQAEAGDGAALLLRTGFGPYNEGCGAAAVVRGG